MQALTLQEAVGPSFRTSALLKSFLRPRGLREALAPRIR